MMYFWNNIASLELSIFNMQNNINNQAKDRIHGSLPYMAACWDSKIVYVTKSSKAVRLLQDH
jgi:hypothetical protein